MKEGFADILPKDSLLWRLKLLKSAASYVNSRLHGIKAEVLMLVSGKDNLVPSWDEAEYLGNSLQNCKVRYFKDNGHFLFMENGIHLLGIIKGASMYRRSSRHDYVLDYLPPSKAEYKDFFGDDDGWFKRAVCPVILSTTKDGKILRGLAGVPNEGPVLLVGNHMLLGADLYSLIEAFLREKNVLVHGAAHPLIFSEKFGGSVRKICMLDTMVVFGAVPVSASNLYRLFSTKSFVLLYPGGAREALHRKGEQYKLFWPDQHEFVRMAARFGAKIIPFGVIGEDDIAELVLDYDDQMSIPCLRDWIIGTSDKIRRLRTSTFGELSNQDIHFPLFSPKIPGRFYYLFGKPIDTERMDMLTDRNIANKVYSQVKSEVEGIISYLKRKREDDPYRSIIRRIIYRAAWGPKLQVPTFEY